MPFVSLIIPVYNVEKYLKQCVDSVLEQNIDNLEIILVDDGSPDSSPKICDDYAKKYKNVRVIHKENGGLSSARNAGIVAAMGEYLAFMDSDDWWNHKVCVSDIIKYIESNKTIDMFLFTSFDFVEEDGYFKRNEHFRFDKIKDDTIENYYQSLLDNGNLEVSACTKFIRADFVKNNGLYFKDGILGEDNEWMIRVLRVLNKVKTINEPLYICRTDRQDSITHTIKEKNIMDLLSIISSCLEYYNDNNNLIKEKELCFASYLWFSALGLSSLIDKKSLKNVKTYFNNTKEVCRYSSSKKTRICNIAYKMLGFNLTVKLLGKYLSIKSKKNITRTKIDY